MFRPFNLMTVQMSWAPIIVTALTTVCRNVCTSVIPYAGHIYTSQVIDVHIEYPSGGQNIATIALWQDVGALDHQCISLDLVSEQTRIRPRSISSVRLYYLPSNYVGWQILDGEIHLVSSELIAGL